MGKSPQTSSPTNSPPQRSQDGKRTWESGAESADALARSERHDLWVLVAVMLVVGGILGSVFAARSVERSAATEARNVFERSSSEVASTLQLAIAHQDDLALNVGAYVLANPNASQADVVHWSEAADHMDRFPEVLGFGFVVIVPAAELPTFIETAVADPVGYLEADGSFEVTPPGDRDLYCLAKYGVVRSVPLTSAGFDFCAADGAALADVVARELGSELRTSRSKPASASCWA